MNSASALWCLLALIAGGVLGWYARSRFATPRASAAADVSGKAASSTDAHQEARRDALTGLPNRRAFDERLAELMSMRDRYGDGFSLVLFDLDNLKQINDSNGHAAGDAVLKEIARVATECRRTSDHVARIGGDEFALLLPKTNVEGAALAAERYRAQISTVRVSTREQDVRPTASVGAAELKPDETNESLFARADSALYAAKKAGRDRVFVHTGERLEQFAVEVK